jgi:hypothetical protein
MVENYCNSTVPMDTQGRQLTLEAYVVLYRHTLDQTHQTLEHSFSLIPTK